MVFRIVALFVITAVAEIVGCYLPYPWLRDRAGVWIRTQRCRWLPSSGCSACIRPQQDAPTRPMAACMSQLHWSGCGPACGLIAGMAWAAAWR